MENKKGEKEIYIRPRKNSIYKNYIKRYLDFTFAFTFLVISIPLTVICCILIKLDSKGPAFFKQTRIGKNCKEITIYKLRTMKIESCDKNGKKLRDRERLTRVGKIIRKLSIDELPQLFNILKGDMSFIGPRPLLVRYLPYYSEREINRHNVLPGITGLAQVNGRSYLQWEERFDYDLNYVGNLSFKLDVKILIITIIKVLKTEGTSTIRPKELVDFDKYREYKKVR
ncbi:sugar transferase [Bacillus sp. B15-48]|uniref:sugar transferase n=1 Tax=Bacillus sp. B15-48 TaxID=1548601 RepID=UPI001EF1DC9F|nr:sugar transferase [Bacillus sp. B15-48]MBM4761464.1 hypothetical protein [Bacillus sp. B15-48]